MKGLYQNVFSLLVYALVAAGVSGFYYYFKRRALVGGFWGGFVAGIIGALIVTLLSGWGDWFTSAVIWLMVPKINETFHFRVNIISAIMGSFLFIYILDHINHKRERKN